MPVITLVTLIAAPPERCFDLSRSVELHLASTKRSGETAVGGKTTGLLDLGDSVTWRAKHFGIWQTLTSRMTIFDRPRHFRDSMVQGAFARFDHDHFFEAVGDGGDGTEMRDVFDFTSPLGPLGWIADTLVLTRYLRRFLEERNQVIREAAERGADADADR